MLNTNRNLADSKSPNGMHKNNKKNGSQYQNYQEQLSNYRRKNRSQLEQWNLMESKLMMSNSSQQYNPAIETEKNSSANKNAIHHHSTQNNKRLVANHLEADTQSQNQDSNQYIKQEGTYSFKINRDFSGSAIGNKKNEQISEQIKSMRKLLVELNTQVNGRLDKYELAQLQEKNSAQWNQPEKEEELLTRKIQVNTKVLNFQEKQIQQIIKRDKQMEENDFLIQLEDKTNNIVKNIHEQKKQKYRKRVNVDRLDLKLIQMRQKEIALEMQDQVRMVKIFKHQILYYFKKFQENQVVCEQLDSQFEQLKKKDAQLTKQFNKFSQLANENNMVVKTNKQYLQNKKIQDQLKIKLQKERRSVEITKFSMQVNQQKVAKQIDKSKREIQRLQIRINGANQISSEMALKADKLIDKHQIRESMVKNLSYKFAQTLLKDSQLKQFKNQQQKIQGSKNSKDEKYYLKPKLNRYKKDLSAQTSSRNRTLQPHQGRGRQSSDKQKNSGSQNDKNHTIDVEGERHSPIRPNLRIKKVRGESSELVKSRNEKQDLQLQVNESESKMVDLHYRPSRLNKLKLSKSKKKVPMGPLSDDYMKSLEKKGLKNLLQA